MRASVDALLPLKAVEQPVELALMRDNGEVVEDYDSTEMSLCRDAHRRASLLCSCRYGSRARCGRRDYGCPWQVFVGLIFVGRVALVTNTDGLFSIQV